MIISSYNKFSNKRTSVDNISFQSQKEAKRYSELKLFQKAGEIKGLELQVKFILQSGFTDNAGNKYRPISYIADFMYWESKNPDNMIIEDAKGMKTEVYKIKKKLLLKTFPDIIFKEV